MPDFGLMLAGEVVPNTEWCIRDRKAWWNPHDRDDLYQMKKRSGPIDCLVGHWTAGEAGGASYDDDGPRVVSVMKRRKSRKDPSRRLRVSVQFVIGACDPSAEFAPVWQTMDPGGSYAAIHVGRGSVNERSIGVEVVSAGLDGPANIRNRPEKSVYLLGKRRSVLAFYPGQLRSWRRLADALSDACLPGGIEIPRRVPVEIDDALRSLPLSRRMTRRELDSWSGAMEHYCIDNTTKIDAGTLLISELMRAGWTGSQP